MRRKRFFWFWQSNLNPWDGQEAKEWERYPDFENNHIEQAFQKRQKQVQLNDYLIEFEWGRQFKYNDRENQRPIER